MRVLIDGCAPKALKSFLVAEGYECNTVQEAGWSGKENGDLLDQAEGRFDVLVTLDRKLPYQQNLAGRKIALLILHARTNRLADLQPHFAGCARALRSIQNGTIVDVGIRS